MLTKTYEPQIYPYTAQNYFPLGNSFDISAFLFLNRFTPTVKPISYPDLDGTYWDYLVFLGSRTTRLFHLCLWRYSRDSNFVTSLQLALYIMQLSKMLSAIPFNIWKLLKIFHGSSNHHFPLIYHLLYLISWLVLVTKVGKRFK